MMHTANLISAILFGPKCETSTEYQFDSGPIEERWHDFCGTGLVDLKSQGRFRIQQREKEVWVHQLPNSPSVFVPWSKMGFQSISENTVLVWTVTKVRWSGWLSVLLPLLVAVVIVFAFIIATAVGNQPIDWEDLVKMALVVTFCVVYFCFSYFKAKSLVRQQGVFLQDLAQQCLKTKPVPAERT